MCHDKKRGANEREKGEKQRQTVRMEHAGDKLDDRGLVGVLLGELEGDLEGAALPRGVLGAKDDAVPAEDVVLLGRGADARGRVGHQALEVAHQPSPCWCGHAFMSKRWKETTKEREKEKEDGQSVSRKKRKRKTRKGCVAHNSPKKKKGEETLFA